MQKKQREDLNLNYYSNNPVLMGPSVIRPQHNKIGSIYSGAGTTFTVGFIPLDKVVR